MEEHPKTWTKRLKNGSMQLWTSKFGNRSPRSIEVRLVPIDDYDEMMRAWDKARETTDDE